MPLITFPAHLKPPYGFEERESNNPDIIKRLYEKMEDARKDFLQKNKVCSREEFLAALDKGDIEALRQLNVPAEYPPYLDMRQGIADNPFERALFQNRPEIVQFLLAAGVNLFVEFLCIEANLEEYLSFAIYFKYIRSIQNEELIKLLIDPWLKATKDHPKRNNPLHTACLFGSSGVVEELLDKGLDLHHKDKDGRTPLFQAAQSGNHEKLELLLKASADATILDAKGNSPLHLHCAEKYKINAKVASLLIDAGTALDVPNESGFTPFWEAIKADENGKKIPLLNFFIDKKVNIDFKDTEGYTPLLWLVVNRKDITMVALLLKAGADPIAQDAEGNTPLHHATKHGNTQMVKLLLKHGADPKLANKAGITPEGLAQEKNENECLNLLLQYSKKVEERAKAKKALETLTALEQELSGYKKQVAEQQNTIDSQTKLIEHLSRHLKEAVGKKTPDEDRLEFDQSRKRQKIAEGNSLDTSNQPSAGTFLRFYK